MYYHKACILVRRTTGHIFSCSCSTYILYKGDKLHSLSLYISHSRETTTNSLNLTATRQNYNDTSLCIAILSPVSNGYLHVWCSRVFGNCPIPDRGFGKQAYYNDKQTVTRQSVLLTFTAACVLL